MKLFLLFTSLIFISTNVESNPFDKLKDIAPVIDLVKKEQGKKKKEEEEKKKKLEEEERKKQEEIEKLEKQKQDEIKEEKNLKIFYKLFNDTGTVLITQNKVTTDDFGDETKTESTYFMVNDQQYDVSVNCKEESFDKFPFNISTRFNRKLDYDVTKSSMFFGHIDLRYKLGSGIVNSYQKNSIFDIINSNLTGVSSNKLNNFSLRGDSPPLNSNLKERKESISNGEVNILIPIGFSEETYSLKFNPFHKSWSDYHDDMCGKLDTSEPDSINL